MIELKTKQDDDIAATLLKKVRVRALYRLCNDSGLER